MSRPAAEKTFMVECFWPDVHAEDVEQGAECARRSAAELRAEGTAVELTGSIHVRDDDVVFYLFDGVSAEAVREACDRAGMTYERVLESVCTSGQFDRRAET